MATYPHTAKITVFVARLSARFPGNLPSFMRCIVHSDHHSQITFCSHSSQEQPKADILHSALTLLQPALSI